MNDLWPIIANMLAGSAAGGVIGLERSYHGRPAGFRTHTLVCLGSSLLMLVTVYERQWFSGALLETVRIDPTRMAQGVMTGIGFLGAGVIVREGLSVRGLTTAASIWVTAAIGIVAGVGLYAVAFLGTFSVLVTLSLFRWIESILPHLVYANHRLKFEKASTMNEGQLRELISQHGISIANMSFSLVDGGKHFEYSMTIRTRKIENFHSLSSTLTSLESVIEYSIAPTGD